MTAALATGPADSPATRLQPPGEGQPQQLSASELPTAQPVQPASTRAIGVRAGETRSVQETHVASGTSGRRALPYLDTVPVSEPPFDDEITSGGSTGSPLVSRVGAAPTTSRPRQETAATTNSIDPPLTAGRRTAIGASGVPPWSSESDVGVRRTGTRALPSATRSAQVFARALVEILSGRRPLAQLRVHCSPDIYAGLLDRPLPAAVCLPHLLTVRVCEPADGVAEVSAAFRRAQRVRAIAFRIQGVDGRWRITALEVG